MTNLQSIQQIFNSKIFRIPDYQRGFSWNEKHLEAFWQDLKNLQKDKYHYTGAITVESVPEKVYEYWDEDNWIIQGKDYKPYYIVDGQQRLTSIIILIYVIAEKLSENDELLYFSKNEILNRYIFKQNDKQSLKSFIFGYEKDNPSYEYLKAKVFEQNSTSSYNQAETVYTNNLSFAKTFFQKKIKEFNLEKLEDVFKKTTQRLKFDFNEIDKELDIFVVFETMNNRGKPLSNLELLKNRLIYLSTLLKNENHEKKKLRNEINDVWKTIYEYLGKNKKNELNDDEFLRTHWIMFKRFSKETEFYKKDIFDTHFTATNLLDGKIDYDEIKKYIESLQKSIIEWFKIKNPLFALNSTDQNTYINTEIAQWLEKLNRLGFTMFEPLTLAVFLKNKSSRKTLDFLKTIEDYIFIVFYFCEMKSHTGQTYIYPAAHELFDGQKNIEEIISKIYDERCNNYSQKNGNFLTNLRDNINGFYDWKGIAYLLFEYEDSLRGENKSKIDWNLDKEKSIEHILPQTSNEIDAYWRRQFRGYSDDQRKFLCNSLGNLLLISKSKNSELSNNSFATKKRYKDKKGIETGYFNGSFSEIEVSLYDDWNDLSIVERGMKILSFMEKRWNMNFGNDKERRKTLLLSFVK